MNLEKSYLIGEVISNSVDTDSPRLSIVDRPPGAANTFIGMGIVAQVMEEAPIPETLQGFRQHLALTFLEPEYLEAARRAFLHLIDDEIVVLTAEQKLIFNPPDSLEYRDLLKMPD